jgi:hypothetical protein
MAFPSTPTRLFIVMPTKKSFLQMVHLKKSPRHVVLEQEV